MILGKIGWERGRKRGKKIKRNTELKHGFRVREGEQYRDASCYASKNKVNNTN